MASIEEDNAKHLVRFKNEPPHPSYIAGVIDGDGCIFIRKIKHGYQSGISLTQCRTNILRVIRYHFGGSITTSEKRNDKVEDKFEKGSKLYYKYNVRNEYNLLLRSNEYKLLLDYIRHSIIIKQPRIERVNDFYKLADIPNVVDQKEELYKQCSELTKNKIMDDSMLPRMSIEYIQGLLDAEGCVYIDRYNVNFYCISISQKSYPIILFKIKEFLGFGKVECNKYLTIRKKSDCLKFISLVKDGLIVKYNQAVAFETYLLTDDMAIKQEMYKICNEEKHRIEHFTDVNCNDAGKEGYDKTMHLRELKHKVCKDIIRKQVYKEKSEKMMGEGHHSFGKLKSEETKKKMSTSIRDAKNGISDEMILKVRELIRQGKKNIEIEQILDLPKQTVTRIKNGTTVCRTEEKVVKEKITQEEMNIKRRKIHLDELFIVVEKTVAGEKPMPILEYLDSLRLKKNINNDLTVDIIKNIKRVILEGKVPFYKREIPLEKYEHYERIITSYSNKDII
jgi:hypothetical protein